MADLTNGVNFLIDWYALAGVPRDATEEEIQDAIRRKRKGYHPDRLERLAPEFKRHGEWMTKLLHEAIEVLLDQTSRHEYDEQLNSWKGPISSDGVPVFDVTKPEYSGRGIVHGQLPSDEQKTRSRQRVSDMSPHNEVLFDLAVSLEVELYTIVSPMNEHIFYSKSYRKNETVLKVSQVVMSSLRLLVASKQIFKNFLSRAAKIQLW